MLHVKKEVSAIVCVKKVFMVLMRDQKPVLGVVQVQIHFLDSPQVQAESFSISMDPVSA